jgi:hypothetical protein
VLVLRLRVPLEPDRLFVVFFAELRVERLPPVLRAVLRPVELFLDELLLELLLFCATVQSLL